jgi:hypothetical protein
LASIIAGLAAVYIEISSPLIGSFLLNLPCLLVERSIGPCIVIGVMLNSTRDICFTSCHVEDTEYEDAKKFVTIDFLSFW